MSIKNKEKSNLCQSMSERGENEVSKWGTGHVIDKKVYKKWKN